MHLLLLLFDFNTNNFANKYNFTFFLQEREGGIIFKLDVDVVIL